MACRRSDRRRSDPLPVLSASITEFKFYRDVTIEGMEEEASLFLFVGAAKLNRMVGDDVALFAVVAKL